MHAAGFMHEQNREERDQYIDVVYPNIMRGYEQNFMKAQKGSTSGFGVGYDYGSVMHYSANAFSANGQPTIRTKVNNYIVHKWITIWWYFMLQNKANIGQRDGFSQKDIQKLNNMYQCKKKTSKNATTTDLIMDMLGVGPNWIVS